MTENVEQLRNELSRVRSLNQLLEARVAELERELQQRHEETPRGARKKSPLSSRSERSVGLKSTVPDSDVSDRPAWNTCTLTEAEAAAKKSRAQNAAFYIPEAPRPPMRRRPCTAPPDSYLRPTAATQAKNVRAQPKRDPRVRPEPVAPPVRGFGSTSPRRIDYRTDTPGVGHYDAIRALDSLNPKSIVTKSFNNLPRFAPDNYRPTDELRFARTHSP
jgi:hypothetical protein